MSTVGGIDHQEALADTFHPKPLPRETVFKVLGCSREGQTTIESGPQLHKLSLEYLGAVRIRIQAIITVWYGATRRVPVVQLT